MDILNNEGNDMQWKYVRKYAMRERICILYGYSIDMKYEKTMKTILEKAYRNVSSELEVMCSENDYKKCERAEK